MIDKLYILDENKKLTCILSNENEVVFYDYEYHSYLNTGADTFDFSVKLNSDTKNKVKGKSFVLFFRNNRARMFQITECEEIETILSTSKTVKSETIALELYNSHVRACIIEGNIRIFLTTVLQDSNYKIGYISPSLDNIIKTTIIEKTTPVYVALQDAIKTYDNIELEFYIDVIDSITGKYELYVNIYADGEKGNKTYKRIESNFNSFGITREENSLEFCSGIIPIGINNIDIKDIEWSKSNGFPLDKPLGQDFILDPEAHALFSNGDKYIITQIEFDDNNSSDLCWSAYNKLQEIKQTKFNYNVSVYLTDEEYETIETGDTVYVVSDKFEPSIQLEARISELILTDSNNECKLSNYKEVKSNIKNISMNDIIQNAINEVTGLGVGKLTQANILAIYDYLTKLNMRKEDIDKIIQSLYDKLVPEIPQIPTDTEDYTKIFIETIEGGLWLGDDKVKSIKDYSLAKIETAEENPNTDNSTDYQEYKDAVKYYATFNLGTNKNNSSLSALMSDNNKYKIGPIVRYWCKKFGLDTRLVYAMIMAESSGNPYSDAAAYGLMQCEKSVYFNKKQTIKFLDGSTRTFTPSYSTMNPSNGITITLNGIKVNQNISNQIMFGCNELRMNLEKWHFNIFATLIGYNMGIGAMGWIIIKYVCDTYGYSFNGGRSIDSQSTAIKKKCYEVLETYKAPFASYRKKWQDVGGLGTLNNIELYLRWYKPYNNSLPHSLDKNGKKIGYGVNTPTSTATKEAVITGSELREKIVAKAKEIVQLHKDKKATYNQNPRTVDDTKRIKWYGQHYGIKDPYAYDCSSFVSCCYLHAGFKTVYNRSASAGTLVSGATAKSGYSMWKCDSEGIARALPGDIVMVANSKVSTSDLTASNMSKYGKTYHTMIYIGDNQVAHASKWAYVPDAIRIQSIDYYKNSGKAFFLRPFELAKADEVVLGEGEYNEDTVIPTKYITEITIKALANSTPSDFVDDEKLIEDITINDVRDNTKYPVTAPYVYVDFQATEDTQSIIDLLLALKNKYKNRPIFVAKANNEAYDTVIQSFANEEDYIIFVDTSIYTVPNSLESAKTYYDTVKTKLKSIAVGGYIEDPNKPPEEVVEKNIDIVLQANKKHEYKRVQNIYFRLPSAVKLSFWSKLIFTTVKDSEPTKVKQSNIVYLEGTDCKDGALLPKSDTTYTIIFMANSDKENYRGFKYFGSVSGKTGGGSYKDFTNFVGKEQIVKVAKTYLDNATKFKYNTKTPLSFSNPASNIGSWKTGGLYHIDCSTFIGLVCRGLTYAKSPYAKSTTSLKRNTDYGWTFNLPRTAADQAKYCVEQGWVLHGVDTVNWSNVEPGDLIFWDRDNGENGRYMNISHVAMVYDFDANGDARSIEVTTSTPPVLVRKIKDNTADKLLFVARIRKD